MSDPPPAPQLARMIDGFVVTQMLSVVAQLGIPELLADGPRTTAELAESSVVDPDALHRVLRGLAAEEVLVETGDGTFELSPLGTQLLQLRGAAIVRGQLYYLGAAGLIDAVRHGGAAFEHHHGEPFFDHLSRNPEQEAAFHASMEDRALQEAEHVVEAYDFSAFTQVADVGGGNGVLLAAILRSAPELTATLLDREAVIPRAQERLDAAGVGSRAKCTAGDFFQEAPAGADAYVLSRVLHDWDDADAVRILQTCRRQMDAGDRLLVVEAVLPERAVDNPATIRMDVHMLLLFGDARERTEAEYHQLLRQAGLRPLRRTDTRSPAGLAVIEAAAADAA
jgi:ubiquinone/menaquinone biosynthesis C-methylase UbiE